MICGLICHLYCKKVRGVSKLKCKIGINCCHESEYSKNTENEAEEQETKEPVKTLAQDSNHQVSEDHLTNFRLVGERN